MNHLYGLLGKSLGHSFSPVIHSRIFSGAGIEGYYHLFEVREKNLKDAIYGLKALGVKGVNVTIPYKIEIMKYLDDVSLEARRIGAVNTVCFKDDKAIGYNTDYYGFKMMLDKYKIDVKNKKAVILGTGGATKAVLQCLLDDGINDIVLVSRDVTGAKEKFKNFKIISYNEIRSLKGKYMIINCTPCGMYPNIGKSPVNKYDISGFDVAIDLIYNPKETIFLRYSKEQGIRSMNGLYMLVGQAVKAQELWNDIKISSNIVEKIYESINSMF